MGNRRLSDNVLLGPPKIRIGYSSQPGSPGNMGSTGALPTRRHSTFSPSCSRGSSRRGSLAPMAGMSLSSSNVNSLLSPKPNLQKRRPSAQLAAEQGAQLLAQLGSNVYNLFGG